MNSSLTPKFVVLAILDGWGLAAPNPGNAITLANTVNINKLWFSYPHTQLEASGQAVGLPKGEDGNTETGHLNLGAGRIVYQDLERINMSIADGSFFQNKALLGAIDHAKKNKSKLHYMGLLGAGGVHSNINHLFALIQLARRQDFTDLFIHIFTDGRDSPPTMARTYVKQLEEVLAKEKVGVIASVMGRYWAMDRDRRWDRTEKAYLALTKGVGMAVSSAEEAVEASYKQGKTDEFIAPSIILDKANKPKALIQDNDSVIYFNFRVDRPRQLTMAFVLDDFSHANSLAFFDFSKDKNKDTTGPSEPFKRGQKLTNLSFVTMTEYSKAIVDEGAAPAFPPEIVEAPLSSVISSSNHKQLKITESEKERFVTFYFNGLRDKTFSGEDKLIIPSPQVPTYDQMPEMSSDELTKALIDKLNMAIYKLVVVNYPNVDMVGHTGNIGPAVKAVEKVDECIGKIANHVIAYGGALIITADHGNAEEMINSQTGQIDTEHSTNPVPLIVVAKEFLGKSHNLRSGILADIAPTILSLLGLPTPSSMTGRDLLQDLEI